LARRASRLEEPCCPQPLVDPHLIHNAHDHSRFTMNPSMWSSLVPSVTITGVRASTGLGFARLPLHVHEAVEGTWRHANRNSEVV
jgi:hypothetical protein